MSAPDEETQLVCDFDQYGSCPCLDGEVGVYECLCDANDAGTACKNCKAVMVRTNIDTGEKVPPATPRTPT